MALVSTGVCRVLDGFGDLGFEASELCAFGGSFRTGGLGFGGLGFRVSCCVNML